MEAVTISFENVLKLLSKSSPLDSRVSNESCILDRAWYVSRLAAMEELT
jgi:hypothetical protein